jgi:hypothetical protein
MHAIPTVFLWWIDFLRVQRVLCFMDCNVERVLFKMAVTPIWFAIKTLGRINKGVQNKKHIEARLVNTDSLFCCLLRSLLFGLSKSLLDHFDWCTSFFFGKILFTFCSIFPIVTFFIGAVQHCCMSSSIEFHFLYHHCHRRKEF